MNQKKQTPQTKKYPIRTPVKIRPRFAREETWGIKYTLLVANEIILGGNEMIHATNEWQTTK